MLILIISKKRPRDLQISLKITGVEEKIVYPRFLGIRLLLYLLRPHPDELAVHVHCCQVELAAVGHTFAG